MTESTAQVYQASSIKSEAFTNLLLENLHKQARRTPSKNNLERVLRVLKMLKVKHEAMLDYLVPVLADSCTDLSFFERAEIWLSTSFLGYRSPATKIIRPDNSSIKEFIDNPQVSWIAKIELVWCCLADHMAAPREKEATLQLLGWMTPVLTPALPPLEENRKVALLMAKQVLEFYLMNEAGENVTEDLLTRYAVIKDLFYRGISVPASVRLTSPLPLTSDDPQKAIDVLFCFQSPADDSKKTLFVHQLLLTYDRSKMSGLGTVQCGLFTYDEFLYEWMLK